MADPHIDQRLAAILAADVAGYSRLMEADERATVATLDAYRTVFQERVAGHGGRIVDTAGDSVLAVFLSAIGAVEAAITIQDELRRRNESLPEGQRMHFRIGVNLGDVIEKDDGSVYGSGVNVAARLESLAEPSGIMISEDVHRQVVGKLNRSFEDAGAHEVKNIAEPVRAYRVNIEFSASKASSRSAKSSDDRTLSLPTGPSIAVLPFTNMSGDPEQEFFSDGITEQIIADLTRFPDLFVIARNTTFQYKGQAVDVAEVGRKLGVQFVLEGSVRRGGDRLRIVAQLIDTATGGHVWAETYDRNLTTGDVFDIQDEITGRVVATIADSYGVISRAISEKAKSRGQGNLEAYEWVLAAHQYYASVRRTAEEHFRIRDGLERAIEISPDYADAWAWLAAMYRDEYVTEINVRPEPLARAERTARKALELDSNNQEGHLVLAHVYFYRHELDAFFQQAERTLSINPNSPDVLSAMGFCMASAGQWDRGMALMEKARVLNPNHPNWFHRTYALNHYRVGEYEEALASFRKSDPEPGSFFAILWFAAIYGQLGKLTEARGAIEGLLELYPESLDRACHELFHKWNHTEDFVVHCVEGLRKAGLDIPDKETS